jgi:hypothetical protein
MVNPYARFLGDLNAQEVIAATPEHLARLVGALGAERADVSPAPGKWSAREILCHLADCETVFAFRLRQTLAEDHHIIQPFDQDAWARTYAAYSMEDALSVFSSVRQWNLALIRNTNAAGLAKPVTHPERGAMTFQTVVETMAGHDLNHINQIESIAARSASA